MNDIEETYIEEIQKLTKKLSGLFDLPQPENLPKIILHGMLSARKLGNIKGPDRKIIVISAIKNVIDKNSDKKNECNDFINLHINDIIETYYWISKQNPEFNPKPFFKNLACSSNSEK